MWISSLIRKPFFSHCPVHEKKKNERSLYCIDCDSILCQHCISANCHNQHRYLRIHRYSYTNAIRVEDIQEHFDCSQIQAYRCNGQKVNVLNPLRGTKGDKDGSCRTCQRKLFNAKLYSFCSIACQVEASAGGSNAPPKRSKSRRKGIPHRALPKEPSQCLPSSA